MKTPSNSNSWEDTKPSIDITTRPPISETLYTGIDSKVLSEYLKLKSLISVLTKIIREVNAEKPYKSMVLNAERLHQELKSSKTREERAARNKIFMDNQMEIAEIETLVHELQETERKVADLEIAEPRLNPTKRNFDIV